MMATIVELESGLRESDFLFHEVFDFNLDSEDEEVFVEDSCLPKKCPGVSVNDDCNIKEALELNEEQWAHIKEQAELVVSLLMEAKQNSEQVKLKYVVPPTPNNHHNHNQHNNTQSSPLTSSPAMNTRSKRKMQLISPLVDITNRNINKVSPGLLTPYSIQKLALSKLKTSNNLALYDQLDLIDPKQLNFDDVEHSPKKNQCLNSYFTSSQDAPLITEETGDDILLASPDVKLSKPARTSPGFNTKTSLDSTRMKSRLRTFRVDEDSSIFQSLCLSSNEKENFALSANVQESNDKVSEPELKPPRQSLLNVSFTIDKNSGIGSSTADVSLNSESFRQTLNESFTINKSIDRNSLSGNLTLQQSSVVTNSKKRKSFIQHSRMTSKFAEENLVIEKNALGDCFSLDSKTKHNESINEQKIQNESYTIPESPSVKTMNEKKIQNESYTIPGSPIQTMNEKKIQNESYTIPESPSIKIMNKKKIQNESYTIPGSPIQTMNEKKIQNESYTIPGSPIQSMNEKKIQNESYTIPGSPIQSMNEKKIQNESYTIPESPSIKIMNEKKIQNESYTIPGSPVQTMNEKKIQNESFTITESYLTKDLCEKKVVNEPSTTDEFQSINTMNSKKTLNESFTIDGSQSVTVPNGKKVLNESYTINQSISEELVTKKTALNESFLIEADEDLNKKPVLNESFVVDKSAQSSCGDDDSLPLTKASIQGSTLKKNSKPEKLDSLLKKSETSEKSSQEVKNLPLPRKRTISSLKPPSTKGCEPASKTTVSNPSQQVQHKMPSIKLSIIPKPSVSCLPTKTNFNLKKPNLNFHTSLPTLQKDDRGNVKFESKSSKVVEKKTKSHLLLPNKLNQRSFKISPQKFIQKKKEPQVEESPTLKPKRKCMVATPPISKIALNRSSQDPSATSQSEAPKTRLVLPSKLPSQSMAGKKIPQSRIPNKGPLKAFPNFGGKVSN